jgi:hypothetical protein
MNPYEAKKEARIERMRARASRLASQSASVHASACAIADNIPMGQPILVGHHSERRHRRDVDKIRARMGKAIALAKESDALARRADAAEENTAVSSDDPDAIEKLRDKLAKIDGDRARWIVANKAVRKGDREALTSMGYSEKTIAELFTPDFCGRIGFADYKLKNAAAEAGRVRKRIAELEAQQTRETPPPVVVEGARIEETDNRVRIVFDQKPEESVRTALKRAGFRWSPTSGAWQRHASNAAWCAARDVIARVLP